MAWTTPPTFVSGNVLTAAQLNVLAADLLETFAADSTGLTDLFTSSPWPVANAANAIDGRQPVSDFDTAAGTTTFTTLDDLQVGNVGPLATVTSGASALVLMNATVKNSISGVASSIGFAISGDTTAGAAQIYVSLLTAAANQQATMTGVRMAVGLNTGVNTFTLKYVVGGGTGTFQRRYLTVIPF